jgi:hypothetical protein
MVLLSFGMEVAGVEPAFAPKSLARLTPRKYILAGILDAVEWLYISLTTTKATLLGAALVTLWRENPPFPPSHQRV